MKNLSKTMLAVLAVGLLSCSFFCQQAEAAPIPFFYNNDFPNNQIGTASRPESAGKIEIESADDFLPTPALTQITSATFTGLIPTGATIGAVRVEIYRVFPNDSDTMRTPNVVTRANSPSDVAFAERSSNDANLSFTTTLLNPNFMASNSILNGINPMPNQFTGGEGPITGQETRFNVDFTTPFLLPADHYFFVPQVELAGTDNFFWLSATRPLTPPSTVFAPDLQSWIRNANLDPDWSRIGADIIDGNPAPTFNASFSLTGTVVPDSGATVALLGLALLGLAALRRKLSC